MNIVRLYRNCTIRDKQNNYLLSSINKNSLTNDEVLAEYVSHELDATTARGVFYSFSTDLQLVKDYKLRNPENADICYIDVDLDAVDKSILGLYPVYLRDYLLCLIANTPIVLNNNAVRNPVTQRKHSLLGIVNVSQRTASSWAYAMREVLVQCDNLRLNLFQDEVVEKTDETEIEKKLLQYSLREPNSENVERLRKIIKESYERIDLKRTYILDRVLSDEWLKYGSWN